MFGGMGDGGKGVKEVVRTFAEMVGRPKLVGRDWLGYLGEYERSESILKCCQLMSGESVWDGSR